MIKQSLYGLGLFSLSTWGQYAPTEADYLAMNQGELEQFQSFPGAPNVIFVTTPSGTWTETQRLDIVRFVQEVVEDYRPFNVNFTFRQDIHDQTAETQRLKFSLSFGAAGVSGACHYNAFGTTDPAKKVCHGGVLVAAHEIGHGMGLHHDGNTSNGYEYDRGNDFWVPIMGRTEVPKYATWGMDYKYSNNTEDDLTIIGGELGWRADDHANTTEGASEIQLQGDVVTPQANNGIISSKEDLDLFRISVGEDGGVDLKVLPLKRYNNLHAKASILDAQGAVVAEGIPIFHGTAAEINVKQGAYIRHALPAGDYYLQVENTGHSANGAEAYTDYGSIGYFQLEGWAGPIKPTAKIDVGKAFYCPGEKVQIQNSGRGFSLDYAWQLEKVADDYTEDNSAKLSFVDSLFGHHHVFLQVSNSHGEASDSSGYEIGVRRIKLSIDTSGYNPDLRVRITNNSSGVQQIFSGENFTLNQGQMELSACVLSEEYNAEFFNPFLEPKCTSRTWNIIIQYKGGDLVMHNGTLWKANYTHSGKEPGVNGSPWTNMGVCKYEDEENGIAFYSQDTLVKKIVQKNLGSERNVAFVFDSTSVRDTLPVQIDSTPETDIAEELVQMQFANTGLQIFGSYLHNISGENLQYQVISVQGRVKMQKNITAGQVVDLSKELSSGRYFVRWENGVLPLSLKK